MFAATRKKCCHTLVLWPIARVHTPSRTLYCTSYHGMPVYSTWMMPQRKKDLINISQSRQVAISQVGGSLQHWVEIWDIFYLLEKMEMKKWWVIVPFHISRSSSCDYFLALFITSVFLFWPAECLFFIFAKIWWEEERGEVEIGQ